MTIVGPGVGVGYQAAQSVPVQPVQLGGLVFQWRGDPDTVTIDGGTGRVASWTALHGGYVASAPSQATQPPYEPTGGPGGSPALVWDAGNRSLLAPGILDASNDMTIIAVLNQTAFVGVGDRRVIEQAVELDTECVGTAVVAVNDGTADRVLGGSVLGPQYLEIYFDSSALTVTGYRNGVLLGSAAYDGTGGWDGLTTGIGSNSAGGGSFQRAKIADIMAFNRVLNATDRQRLRAQYMPRYGL